MSTQKARGTQALEHVMFTVLGLFDTSPLVLSLHQDGYDCISDIATMTDKEIDDLVYQKEGVMVCVIKKQRKQLKHLLYWRDWRSRQLNHFAHEEWMKLSSDSFNDFCLSILPDIIRGSTTSSSAGSNNHVVTSSEVASFKKSIDKSQSDFPQYNGNIAKWIPTKQTYLSVAANHGISRILDDSEVPAEDSKDRELFDAQNQYFYNILKVKVTGGKAKVIVNQHILTLDAKSVWKKFVEYYEDKSIVSLNKANYFDRMSSLKLTPTYKGGPHRFLNDFENLVTEMNVSVGTEMKDSDLVGFLTTAISEYEPFQATRASLDTNALLNKSEITYDGMLNVLYKNCPKKPAKSGRIVNSLKYDKQTRGYNDVDDGAWKKDYTKWVPIKIFKNLPEKEQAARQKAQKAAKGKRKEAKLSAAKARSDSDSDNTGPTVASDSSGNDVFEIPKELAPTFREIMSAKKVETKKTDNGETWVRVCKASRTVRVSNLEAVDDVVGGLVDSGANTGLQGADMRMLYQEHGSLAVIGVANEIEKDMDNLPIVTCGGVATNSLGENVIVVLTSAAAYGKGKSVLSKFQLEHYGCKVHDRPRALGGRQVIQTPDGHVFKLKFKSGLMYLPMRCPSDMEVETLPHVYLTSNAEQWNPDNFGDDVSDDQWFDAVEENEDVYAFESKMSPRRGKRKKIDFEKLRKFFLWKPVEAIKKTFGCTTQFVETVWFNTPRLPLCRHYKTRVPFMNCRRLNEGYATDTIFSNCKAHDGSTCAQIYVGVESQFVDIEGMTAKSQMPRTLLNFIRQWGAMRFLWRDMAKEEDSKAVNDLLRSIQAPNRFSEPYNEHQNPAELKILDVKAGTRTVMDRTGTPNKWWLLCMMYVIYVMNHIALASLGWQNPIFRAFGITKDISPILLFTWWEPVLYYDSDVPFPGSRELRGKFAGFADNVGDAFCFRIVTDDTEEVIYRSVLRTALDEANPNLRPFKPPDDDDPESSSTRNGEMSDRLQSLLTESQSETQPVPPNVIADAIDMPEVPLVLESSEDLPESDVPTTRAHFFDPDELIGKTFLREREVDGTIHRAEIMERIQNAENVADQYLVKFGDGTRDEVMNYNAIVDLLNKQIDREMEDESAAYTFKGISNHRKVNNKYEVLVDWETGEKTWEPIAIMRQDDPVTLAKYGLEHNLLDQPGWKRLRNYVKSTKRLSRNIKQARMFAARTVQRYKFGVKVPRGEREARLFDEDNKNNQWDEAITKELDQVILEYEVFKDKGKFIGKKQVPNGYQMIRLNMVFDVKHDLRHKMRLVAGGHLTQQSGDTSYSSVASLRSIRLVTFIAELNKLELEAGDVGNAYLEAETNEKVCFVAGPSFAKYGLEGHLLIIHKALYGLRNSGACYHAKWANSMQKLGFFPSRADPDVWMRDKGDHYEYIVVYVDDLLYAGRDADQYWKDVKSMGYKLKGVGPPTYHLGATFERVKEPGTDKTVMTWGPVRYIQKILDQYERMFGEKVNGSRKIHAPLEPGDHPELDTSELCNEDEKAKYLSLVGSLQWALSLGRMDIGTATMTMSRFRVSPRKGHLERLKRIYRYLKHFKNTSIKFNTEIPDYSYFDNLWKQPEWGDFYGDGEGVYDDPKLPNPKGNPIVMTTYVDANLLHDYITGRSCTGIIHLFNKTVMDWFSKLQSNVETATYGSEFTALRTAVDQIHDLRYSARALGVPIIGPTYLFGDNLSTIISSTKSDGKIAKRWNILSFHRVREAVAHGIVRPFHIDGKDNPADVLSKHTSSSVWYELMRPLIFWRNNDTVSDECEIERSINVSNSQVMNLSKSDTDTVRINSTSVPYVLDGTELSTKIYNADADAAAESFRVRFV